MSRDVTRVVNEQPSEVRCPSCPRCPGAVRLRRVRRNPLMRLLGSTTRLYACPDCEARYFKLRRWMMRLSRGRA